MSEFLIWLDELIKCLGGGISEHLFCHRPEYLLTFVGIGMAIVIFTLSQTIKKLDEAKKLKERIVNREFFSKIEIVHQQAKNEYWKFITLVEKVGVLYFVSASFIVLLISYPFPPPNPIPLGYIMLANFAYLMLISPTLVISIYYFYFRLFRHRLH